MFDIYLDKIIKMVWKLDKKAIYFKRDVDSAGRDMLQRCGPSPGSGTMYHSRPD